MTRARTYIKLNESRVGKIKSQIEPIIPDDWMREENPHISILPSFKIPTEYEDEIQKRIQTTLRQFSLYRVKIKGYHIYPPLDSNQQTYVLTSSHA